MFGDSLLVAPVFHASEANFYLPAGTWTCFWTNETISGPAYIKKTDYPLDMIPVFVKQGSVLLLGPEDVVVPDYEYGKVELEVREYALGDEEVVVSVPSGKGSEWVGEIKVKKGGQYDAGSTGVKLVASKA
jgi:alpha-glucosidase (family GH31 glycosyl hydrolase)